MPIPVHLWANLWCISDWCGRARSLRAEPLLGWMNQAKESKPVSNTASQPLPPFPPPGSCLGWPTTSCKWKEVVSSPSCFLVMMFYHSNRESETAFPHCCCWLSLGHADRRDMLEPLEVGPKTMCKMYTLFCVSLVSQTLSVIQESWEEPRSLHEAEGRWWWTESLHLGQKCIPR